MIAALLTLWLACPAQDAAAPGRWSAPGGDPAGSARSFARPLQGEPEVAWTWSSPATIDGEVSTWDGQVLFSVRESSGRRALVLLDLESGQTRLKHTLRATLPLAPSMDGDVICVRPSAERVDVYRLRDGRIGRPRTIRAQRSISTPLLVEGELYLRIDDSLQRYDVNKSQSIWTARLPGVVRGRPALLGSRIFVLFYAADGAAQIAILDRADGRLLGSASMGNHGGRIPSVDATASLHPSADRIFVRYPLPVSTRNGGSYSYGSRVLRGDGFDSNPASLHDYNCAPLIYNEGWIASENSNGRRWLRVRREGGEWRVHSLADANNQALLAQNKVAPALAGDVIYFGGLAADLKSDRVLWKRPASLFRPTPVDRGLLVVEEPTILKFYRAQEPPSSPAKQAASAHGTRLEFTRAEQMAELAKSSIRSADGGLTRRLIDHAQRLGASAKQLAPAFRALDRIADNSKPANPAGNNYRALLTEEKACVSRPGMELGKLAAKSSGELQRLLLRMALLHEPGQASARAQVRAMVPQGAKPEGPFDALAWLDYLDVAARFPIRFTGADSSAEDQRHLAMEQRSWRSDLSGFRSERLHIIAPSNLPGAVAACLENGELLCDLLEELFSRGESTAAAPTSPMLILLYPTREEYVAQSNKAGSAPEEVLGWTAGHYSAQENRSRMFVPSRQSSNNRLLEVYAHELTHHWLASRSPFSSRQGSREAPFWIVEGFATLISEFTLSPQQGTWSPSNPRAGSLDALGTIPESELLPWSKIANLDHPGFAELPTTPRLNLPLSWTLGLSTPLSTTQIYYAQSSALAQMLFNESPQSRERLLSLVRAWYTQDAELMDAAKVFGMQPDELGKRTRAFARQHSR